MKRSFKIFRWAAVLLFVALVAMLMRGLYFYTDITQERITFTPWLMDARGWQIYTMQNGERTELTPQEMGEMPSDETVYLSRVLDAQYEADGYTTLMLWERLRPYSVWLDGALLYTTCPQIEQTMDAVRFPADYEGVALPCMAICCTLPNGYAGKTLTIATVMLPAYRGSMPGVFLSGDGIEGEYWMKTASKNTMPAVAWALCAVLLLGLLVYNLFQGKLAWSLLLLAAATLAQMFSHLREYSFYAPASTAWDTPLMIFIPQLTFLLSALYLVMQMRRWRKLCTVFLLISAVPLLVCPLGNILGIFAISEGIYSYAFYIGLVALLACAVLEVRDGNRVFRMLWGALCGICVCVTAVSFAVSPQTSLPAFFVAQARAILLMNPHQKLSICGTLLLAVAIFISVCVIIRDTADTQAQLAVQKTRLDRLDYELLVQKQFYETRLTNEQELRAIRHDMKTHLNAMSALLADGKTAEVAAYLEQLTQRQEHPGETFCDNPYLNAVLGSFTTRFQENEIPFTCHIGVGKQPLPGVELCLILGNALENALEASLLQPQTERGVSVQARVHNGQFLLRVSNRFKGIPVERDGLPVTTKQQDGHGYGMANIRSTAQRLGGAMYYRAERGEFVLEVHFPVTESTEAK